MRLLQDPVDADAEDAGHHGHLWNMCGQQDFKALRFWVCVVCQILKICFSRYSTRSCKALYTLFCWVVFGQAHKSQCSLEWLKLNRWRIDHTEFEDVAKSPLSPHWVNCIACRVESCARKGSSSEEHSGACCRGGLDLKFEATDNCNLHSWLTYST